MYSIIKNVIENREFELSDIIKKIDTQWVRGSISSQERDELCSIARDSAEPNNSIDVYAKLAELEKRIKLLEDGENVQQETTPSEFVTGKTYYKGDTVVFGGKKYICIAPEGAVCVWSPSDYPAYWQEQTEGDE